MKKLAFLTLVFLTACCIVTDEPNVISALTDGQGMVIFHVKVIRI